MKKMQWILAKTIASDTRTNIENAAFNFLTPIPPWLTRDEVITNTRQSIQNNWPTGPGESLTITFTDPIDPFTASAEAIGFTIEGLVASADHLISCEMSLKTEVGQLTAQLAEKQLALQDCKNRTTVIQSAQSLLEGKKSIRHLVLVRQLSHVDSAVVDISEVVELFNGDHHQAVEAITSLFYLTRTHASVRLYDNFDGNESAIEMWKVPNDLVKTWETVVKNVKGLYTK